MRLKLGLKGPTGRFLASVPLFVQLEMEGEREYRPQMLGGEVKFGVAPKE